jgi:hypothetical protein
MKYFLILFFISSNAMAQNVIILPMQDGKVFYEKVYQDSGATKEQLYLQANEVFLRTFPDTKSVIQQQDKEAGIIAGKGYFPLRHTLIRCTIRISTKDGKYKVEMFDFYPVGIDGLERSIENNYAIALKKQKGQKSWQDFNNTVLQVLNEIETEMNKKSTDF